MRKHIKNIIESKIIIAFAFLIAVVIVPLNFYLTQEDLHASADINVEKLGRKIVVFKNDFNDNDKQDNLIKFYGGNKVKNLKIINGQAIYITEDNKDNFLKDKNILRIEDDIIFKTSGRGGQINQPSQIIPWGIIKINADKAWQKTTGNGSKIAIIDTGVESNHPDLLGRIQGGYNAINPAKSSIDDNGHGTHVAGIISALNNNIGTVGAGSSIDIYAVKSLNKLGNGYLSDIIEGIDWAISNKMQVINMSLGSNVNSLSFHNAVKTAYDNGIILVAAAGNNGGAVSFPAAYPEVIAVSAVDENLQIASFSNRGSEIDLAAPGVNIFSTYKGQAYQIMNGTSMASPYVTGVVGLLITQPVGTYDTDGDNLWDAAEIQNKIKATSTDLGNIGFDDFYGYGLVNAENAVN